MSTLTVVPADPVRAVSWSRLGWVAWRRYRMTAAVTAAVLAARFGLPAGPGPQLSLGAGRRSRVYARGFAGLSSAVGQPP